MAEILHQLRLVVYSHCLQGFKNIQTVVVWDFSHQQYPWCQVTTGNRGGKVPAIGPGGTLSNEGPGWDIAKHPVDPRCPLKKRDDFEACFLRQSI